jgi:hypothetical protein
LILGKQVADFNDCAGLAEMVILVYFCHMKVANVFMKQRIVTFGLLMCVFHGFGQDKPSFIAIRSGISVPFGKYHEKSLDGGSFTLTGFNVAAEGAWFFNPEFGVGASIGMNMHPVDVRLLGYEKVQSDPFLSDLYIRSNPYLMITAMGGLYTQLPLMKKLSFTGKALCGLLYGETPYQLYKPEYFMVGPDFYEITPSKDWKFSWQAGIGLKYDITPCYGLVFDTDLVLDKLSFGFDTSTGVRTDVKTISFFNTTLGVRFNL